MVCMGCPFIINMACFLPEILQDWREITPNCFHGEAKTMQMLFYASKNDKDKKRLKAAIHKALPGKAIEPFRKLNALRQRFNFIIEPDSIAILLAANLEELGQMQVFRKLLPEIYVILVIPDWQESTVTLAHLLLPRFLCLKEDNFTDLIKVLKKMVQTPPGDIFTFLKPPYNKYAPGGARK